MVPIRAGSFTMGSTKAEQDSVLKSVDPKFRKGVQDWLDTEGPQHEVRISKSFYMAAHPVTVGQFRQFVAEAKYRTDAERDGKGAWGYNAERKRHEGDKPQYTWRATGWHQTDRDPVVNVTWDDAAVAHGTLTPDSAARPIATIARRARVGSGLVSESRSFLPGLICKLRRGKPNTFANLR
jgi:formylglycine-generating enzyme required for sulfatase activity